jgi:hypothetical protein
LNKVSAFVDGSSSPWNRISIDAWIGARLLSLTGRKILFLRDSYRLAEDESLASERDLRLDANNASTQGISYHLG